ncbi:protein-tyrosine-phosphatase [Mucor circinelloides]
MIDPANHPLYIHCLDGADVTGLVIACLRKLQMWSISSALGEFVRNLHTSVISSEEFEFVENFKNFEVTIPMSLPLWLWGGQVNFRKHTSLRLKFLNPEMMTEEERELKDLKEKKEREKEDYYKKRKNDLLDNLFDPNATAGTRHRSGSTMINNNSNNSSNNNNNNNNNGSSGAGGGVNGSNGSNHVSSSLNANNSSINAMTPSTPGMDDVYATATSSSIASESSTRHGRNETDHAKDPYLVDVDVDVDGVMMDGLDQVEYMNRANGGSSGNRFYGDGNENVLLMDNEGDIYNGEQGTRFITEPISRTLEALALEGLTEF